MNGAFDQASLKKIVLGGLTAGVLGAAALFAGVEPTIEFFAVMGGAIGILSFIIEGQTTPTGGTTSTTSR